MDNDKPKGRIRRDDIAAVETATGIIELEEGQAWFETGKAYEVWIDGQWTKWVRRIRRRAVLQVYRVERRVSVG